LTAHDSGDRRWRQELRRKMWRALDEIKPQVVVLPGWSFADALSALLWCAKTNTPSVVMTESTDWDEQRISFKEWVKSRLVRLNSAGLAGGTPHRDYLRQLGLPGERVFFGYDVVDNEHFARRAKEARRWRMEGGGMDNGQWTTDNGQRTTDYGPQTTDHGPAGSNSSLPSSICNLPSSISDLPPSKFFLASARFVEKKNLPRLIQAYARYRTLCGTQRSQTADHGQQTTDNRLRTTDHGLRTADREASQVGGPVVSGPVVPWNMVLLGDGPLRASIFQLRSSLGLENCLHLPGFKQYEELPVYFGLAGAFVHASTTEQWGLVVNEAMASGLPVLVSHRCGCAEDLVSPGVNGFQFDPANVDEMARLMFKVSQDDFPLSEFGAASSRIISQWGPERFATGLRDAVATALKHPRPRAGVLDQILLRLMLQR